ncbi:MAG TPA: type II toxin-antitoxin system death-on-curing family toxin [Candidatus Omnitrophota bacterium]|nr:type II toxin-antitoxin system death-on-curing family toxin [Candidatus Omnitrophota bacterium]HPN55993.1 type II toxin-antitoxin system death-on-curing family toxin [Candidatus Omnitrophota bacterium]
MKYLYPKQVIYLHKQIISETGGTQGVRDRGLLESAVYRPQASFGGRDLYPDLYSKTAVLCYFIIHNYPFVDGNKRVGYEGMRLMLRVNGYDINASPKEKFEFIMSIAKGEMNERNIAYWISTHSSTIG